MRISDWSSDVCSFDLDIVDITLLIEKAVRKFNVQPRIALLSYSNFGSNAGDVPRQMREAVARLHAAHPELLVEGEMQANFATNGTLLEDKDRKSTRLNSSN